METKITKGYFQNNGKRYFRVAAENIDEGAFGQKKHPLGKPAYLARHGAVRAQHLSGRVRCLESVKVDWDKVSQGDAEVNGKLKVYGVDVTAAEETSFESARKYQLELMKLTIDEGKLIGLLADADVARRFLAEEGSDGRIVSSVWLVVRGEVRERFRSATAIDVTAGESDGVLKFSARGGSHGASTLTYAPGVCFAFGLHKVNKWSGGRTVVESVEDDYAGLE